MELPKRKKRILKAIVESYIDTAEPVGSKTLVNSFDGPISSATIRNEMSELEELGFLEKPHVSAGRIPSYAAYRLYVNELMERHRVATDELEAMRLMMQAKMREIDNIMVSASKVLSEMTQHTAVSMISRSGGSQVKKCELIDVDGGYTYAVVLVTGSEVKNKMLLVGLPDDIGYSGFYPRHRGRRQIGGLYRRHSPSAGQPGISGHPTRPGTAGVFLRPQPGG